MLQCHLPFHLRTLKLSPPFRNPVASPFCRRSAGFGPVGAFACRQFDDFGGDLILSHSPFGRLQFRELAFDLEMRIGLMAPCPAQIERQITKRAEWRGQISPGDHRLSLTLR